MPHIYVEVSKKLYKEIGKKVRDKLNDEWRQITVESMPRFTIDDVDIRWVKTGSRKGTAAVTIIVEFTTGPRGISVRTCDDTCENINYVYSMALQTSENRKKYLPGKSIAIIPRPQYRGGYFYYAFR